MAKFTISQKPPSPETIFGKLRASNRKIFDKHGRSHRALRRDIVRGWSAKNRASFSYEVTETFEQITLTVSVKEKTKKRPMWKWLSQTGTKPHVIKPKKKNKWGLLFFVSGGPGSYDPKTRFDAPYYGGTGKVRGGRLMIVKQVNHPGFPPRKFDEKINDNLEPEFRRTLFQNAKRTLKKALKSK